C
ncbi:hypothetical protein BN1723_019562, partial [Verticillium longisporum]